LLRKKKGLRRSSRGDWRRKRPSARESQRRNVGPRKRNAEKRKPSV
jgi:hypothetical protein